jgi:hypothetical protein
MEASLATETEFIDADKAYSALFCLRDIPTILAGKFYQWRRRWMPCMYNLLRILHTLQALCTKSAGKCVHLGQATTILASSQEDPPKARLLVQRLERVEVESFSKSGLWPVVFP